VSGNIGGISGSPYPGIHVGGGIINSGFQGNASVTLIHSTVSGNTAGYAGGGIYEELGATLTLRITHT
jgi:hypothetical protein